MPRTTRAASMKSKTPVPAIYQLKVTLLDIEPPIWRRLLVPGDVSLFELHEVLQVVMGWTNSHLHEFRQGDTHYGVPDEEFEDLGMELKDDGKHTLAKVLPKKGRKILYTYDMGDSWEHLVVVEAVHTPQGWRPAARCLDGARRCPPEDVGSTPGYEEFLKAIKDPRHPEHAEMLEWCGGSFEPEAFSVEDVNRELAALGKAGSLARLWGAWEED